LLPSEAIEYNEELYLSECRPIKCTKNIYN